MIPESILVHNIFYINRLVFSVLSHNIGESATFVTLMEHSWYICFNTNSLFEQHHWILDIRIRLAAKFQLQLLILIFWTKFAQKLYFRLKTKKWASYWTLRIPISLDTQFQVKLVILTFWTKFSQKQNFQSQTKKVSITTEFCILGLV